jgi:hypothetical protein
VTPQADQYTEPPEDVRREMDRTVTLTAASAQTLLDTLRHLDEFLRCYASPVVRAELHAFCTNQGRSAVCGAAAFVDSIGFITVALRHAIDTATDHAGSVGADRDKETA